MRTPSSGVAFPLSFVVAGALASAQVSNPQQARPGQGLAFRPAGTERLMTNANALTGAAHVPGDPNRLFVYEQRGRILILDLTTNTVDANAFLDIDSRVSN